MISKETIDEILARTDIENLIGGYVSIKRAGDTYKGLCPFHSEKTPSFTVYPENGSFYCFGCKVGGDVFTFTKLIENLDYIDAVKLLAERCGVTVIEGDKDDSLHNLKNSKDNLQSQIDNLTVTVEKLKSDVQQLLK